MKSIKALLTIVLITIAFSFVGCNNTDKVTDTNSLAADVNNLAADANKVSATTDQLQAVAKQVLVVLEAAGAVDKDVVDKVEKISIETDKVQIVFDNIVAALKANNIAASSDNIEAVLNLILKINSATASVNPWATWIDIIIIAALALLSIWKTFQASKSNTALTQIVTGVEAFKENADAATVENFKAAQSAIQSPQTAGMVAQIKAAANGYAETKV